MSLPQSLKEEWRAAKEASRQKPEQKNQDKKKMALKALVERVKR